MVKEELVSGIKMAVAEGESLENAMATFYNAGYLKDDIEEAALAVQSPAFSPEELQQLYQKRQAAPKTVAPTTPASQPNQQTIQNIPMLTTAKGVQIQPIMVQRASDYGKKPSRAGSVITIILVILLLILLGALAAVIIFKNQLSNILSNLLLRALF